MKYRIIVRRGFARHRPYTVQRKTIWFKFWKDVGSFGFETLDSAKESIRATMSETKRQLEISKSLPKPGIVLVYTSEDQVVDKLKGIG